MSAVAREVKMDRKDIDTAIDAWARWARSALSGLGYSPISMIGKIVEFGLLGAVAAQSSGAVRLMEIDETCEIVDRAILRLDPTEREAVIRTYLPAAPEAAQVTARRCGLTYGYYRDVLHKARKRIGDFLDGARLRHVV